MNITGKRKSSKYYRSLAKTRAAKAKAKKRCLGMNEVTGEMCDNLQCHHVIPIWKDPSRCDDLSNLIMIPADIHEKVVHDGHFELLNGMPEEYANAYRSLYLLAH